MDPRVKPAGDDFWLQRDHTTHRVFAQPDSRGLALVTTNTPVTGIVS